MNLDEFGPKTSKNRLLSSVFTTTDMDLTLGPLALLVVNGKFCLLMNKKVSAWVISMFGLMLLGQPQQ